jgi:hypothetical protein
VDKSAVFIKCFSRKRKRLRKKRDFYHGTIAIQAIESRMNEETFVKAV